ncbi:hypothetical protein BVC80_5291g1 [Macleaya cordata]|uniref:FIGL1 N-terminal domain-containing protein n=1 Tax=Macleaya cordata TaxID=56857 RepID=A0A200QPK8_MACCD|nr:hypothetical protein BVC80_5291g1 [Macleaya cordata]
MEKKEAESVCWRKEMDINLKRLQSHLFGVDRALEREDFSSAQILGLRLLGFLDSQSKSDVDKAYIHPIRQEVRSKIDTATRSLATESDRLAFEQARIDQGPVFVKKGNLDIEKVKQSKCFQAFLRNSEASGFDPLIRSTVNVHPSGLQGSSNGYGRHLSQAGQLDRQNDKFSSKNSKVMTQTKLTSLYSSKVSNTNTSLYKNPLISKSNSSVDYNSERVQSYDQNHHKSHSVSKSLQVEDDEKPLANRFGTKRIHLEVSSHGNENVKPPPQNEETDVSGNGFVTARTKLVFIPFLMVDFNC